jgi:hypothetical protein
MTIGATLAEAVRCTPRPYRKRGMGGVTTQCRLRGGCLYLGKSDVIFQTTKVSCDIYTYEIIGFFALLLTALGVGVVRQRTQGAP